MTRDQLLLSIGELDELRKDLKPSKDLQVEMLWQDLNDHYLTPYNGLPSVCRKAFDQIVRDRLDAFIPLPTTVRKAFAELVRKWKERAATASVNVHFGQMRVGPDFQGQQGGGNVNQQAVVGLPDEIIGRPIAQVSGMIRAEDILPDQMPISIFWAPSQRWICANNRGYTAYCKANVRPRRLIPRVASQDELNRLGEVESQGTIGTFTYPDGYGGTRLGTRPRTLPSWEMPVTTGPNTWTIQEVVVVPLSWR
jgi:hypothetical protein